MSATNYYGRPITPAEHFDDEHIANVPPIGGLPPVCSCGWTPHGEFTMADHLRDMDAHNERVALRREDRQAAMLDAGPILADYRRAKGEA